MGPHPSVAATRSAVTDALASTPRAAPVLVACSGGADSTALAAAAAFVGRRDGRPVSLATVDHGLQAGSAGRARDVAALAGSLGLDAAILTVAVAGGPGAGGPEAAARTARYRALDTALAGLRAPGTPAPALLLGHTLDDQAETVLLGLGRGAGPRSLAGMAPSAVREHGVYLRPFLGLRRADLRQACEAQQLRVWDDPHNSDPRYRRVRLRNEALPVLEEVLGGGVAGALARTAALQRDDLAALDDLASDLLAAALAPAAQGSSEPVRGSDAQHDPQAGLAVRILAGAPRALRTRVLRTWLALAGAPAVGYVHLAAADRLIVGWRGQRHVDLPGGFALARESGRLVLHDAALSPSPPPPEE